jgi:hypothetical protein
MVAEVLTEAALGEEARGRGGVNRVVRKRMQARRRSR